MEKPPIKVTSPNLNRTIKIVQTNNIMIIDFTVNFNNYDDRILKNYSIIIYTCPKCGAKHSLTRHGCYERNVFLIDEFDNIQDRKMLILRVKCSSCRSTHAILPNDIIPYCIYSFSFILKVLTAYYSKQHKVKEISSNFSISFQVIYVFISKLSSFLNSCKSVLRSLSSSMASTLNAIVASIANYQLNGNFLYQYFFNSQWIFLMLKFQNVLPRAIYIGGFY